MRPLLEQVFQLLKDEFWLLCVGGLSHLGIGLHSAYIGTIMMIKKSWLSVAPTSDFSLQNIPFGIVKHDQGYYAATRIGEEVINLSALQAAGYFADRYLPRGIFEQPYLNDFIGLGKPVTARVREKDSIYFRWRLHRRS